jgi:predicted amidophosphoribosyltransferase
MSKINKVLAILAVLAFFLPFITISCNNKVLVQVSGAKVVQCSVSPCSGKDFLSPNLRSSGTNMPGMNIPTEPSSPTTDKKLQDANFVLFAAIASLIAVIGLFIAGRGGELLSAVASIAVIVLLIMFHSKFTDAMGPQLNSPEMNSAGITLQLQLQFGIGFWLSMVMSACSAIVAFKGTSAAQNSVPVTRPIGGFAPQGSSQISSGFGQPTSLCPACGASNTADNKFCLSCGGSLAAAAPPVPPALARVAQGEATEAPPPATTTALPQQQDSACPSCGASNPAGNKFCLACGGSLMANVQLFQPKETTAASASPEPITAAAAAPFEQQGADMSMRNVTATMAAAAAASLASQTLPLVARSRETPEPPATTSPAPEVLEHQPSLDWESQPESPKPSAQPCAACGAAIGEGQKFCLACGAPIGQRASVNVSPSVAEPEPTRGEHAVCAACDAALSEGQKFCLSCGTPVTQATAIAPQPPAALAPIAEPHAATSEAQLFATPQRSSAKTLVVVVVLLGVLGAGGWYGWKYFTRPDVTVTTFPQKTHVAIGGKTSVQASVSGSKDTDVTWTIQEGNKGGQVVDLGAVMASGQLRAGATYSAPQTTGVFHVVVTSHANPGRSAKIEIVVGGSQPADTSTPPPQPASTPAPATSSPTNPMAEQIVGTWRGPSPGMQTVIGADASISMTSETDATKNLTGTYRFTDKSHLDVDFANGDVRKWEIVGIDNNYLRVTSQSKDGTAAIVFAKIQ